MRVILFLIVVTSLILTGFGLNSCSSGSDNPDTGPGPVTPTATVSPESPATINGTTPVVITFSTGMDVASLSLSGNLSAESNGGIWSANDTILTISPQSGTWGDSSGVAKTLSLNANSPEGVSLASLNLSYIIDTTLQVPSVSPANSSTIANTSQIVINYDETMDTASLVLAGSMASQGDGGVWSTTTNTSDTLTVTPTTPWTNGGHTLDVTANDLVGNSSTVNLSYTVTTDADSDGYPADQDCNDNDPNVNPGAIEVCDGVDNNCDTQIDEGFSNLGNTCSVGTGTCSQQGSIVCTVDGYATECNAVAGTPSQETCDGLDNDCDGYIDNNLTAPLCPQQTGVCSGSVQICGGVQGWTACNQASYGPDYETNEVTCDNKDNDCDGMVDENIGTVDNANCTQSVCSGGVFQDTPLSSGTICRSASSSCDVAETCNGVDMFCPSDGIQAGSCQIGGVCYSDGADNPANDCEQCNASVDQFNWTSKADGTACGDGVCNECSSGACVESTTGTQGPGCTSVVNDACTAPDTCQAGGFCAANDAPASTACGTCSECDGAGGCSVVPTTDATCGNYTCGGLGVCNTSCTSDAQCAGGTTCDINNQCI